MAVFGTILKMLLRYAPDVYAITKQVGAARGKPAPPATGDDLKAVTEALGTRLDTMEESHERLRLRLREMDSHLVFLTTLVYIGGIFLAVMVIIALVLAIVAVRA